MALTTVPVELANLDGAVTVNESSADVDFRVESNGSANMLFVDGGNDEVVVQRASSGATATAGSVLIVEDDDNAELSILGGSSSLLALNFGHSGDADDGIITYNTTSGSEAMGFSVAGGTNALTLSSSAAVFNEGSADIDFRVESDSSANMLVVDAGNNKVLIEGQNTASVTDAASMQAAGVLEINGNGGEGSDHIKMGAMADGTGNQFIEATNSGATAAYDLLLQPINGGTVGIGTTNAYDTLHISRTSTTQTAGLTLENLQPGGYGSGITWESKRSDSSNVQTAARIYVAGLNSWGSDADADSQMLFYVRYNNSLDEIARMDGEGLRMGRSSGAGATDHGVDIYSSGYLYIYSAGSGDTNAFRVYNSSGTLKAAIDADGDYHDHSDENAKENISDASSVLSTIADIKVRSFNWKEDGRKQSYGFVAQELKDVVPEATKIPQDDEEMWGIKTSKIVPMLTKAIQEQQTLIETLEAKVKALEEA